MDANHQRLYRSISIGRGTRQLCIPRLQEFLLFLFGLLFVQVILGVVCFDVFRRLCCRLIKAWIVHAVCV